MERKWIWLGRVGLGLLIGLLVSAAAMAQPVGPGGGRFRGLGGGMGQRDRGPGGQPAEKALQVLSEYLELTPEQVSGLEETLLESKRDYRQKREEIDQLENQLQERLEAGSPDPTEVGNLVIRIHGLRLEGREARGKITEALKSRLSPDQVAKLEALTESSDQLRVVRAAKAVGLLAPQDTDGRPPRNRMGRP